MGVTVPIDCLEAPGVGIAVAHPTEDLARAGRVSLNERVIYLIEYVPLASLGGEERV